MLRRPVKVFVGRSKSAHGPFVDSKGIDMLNNGGDVVLASHGDYYAPGGQAIFTDYNRKTKTSRDVFVYHYVPVVSPDGYNDTYSTLGLNGIDWRTVSCSAYASGQRMTTNAILI